MITCLDLVNEISPAMETSIVTSLLCFLLISQTESLQVTTTDLDTIVQLTILRAAQNINFSANAFDDLKKKLKDKVAESTCDDLKKQYPDIISSNRTSELCSEFVEQCPSSAAIASMSSNLKSFSEAIQKICPILLFEPLCHDKPINELKVKSTSGEVWAYAIVSVTIISCTSLVGVVIVPFLNRKSYLNVINLFEGLAVGSLTGSAIFHLIPQSFNLLTSESKHDYLWKTLVIFGGIYLFYWSERIMNIIVQIKDRNKDESPVEMNGKSSIQPDSTTTELMTSKTATLEQRIRTTSESLVNDSHQGHHHHHQKGQKIATVAWMIIFGDGLHNFIDGLSIGAAFSENILTGVSICLAVVCEEFPHELGDFAVLIASGMSIKQAVGYNFLSACTCYLGMIIGILLGDQGPTYIFALAGQFLIVR